MDKLDNIKVIFIDWYKTISFNNFWNHFKNDGRVEIYNALVDSLYLDNKNLIKKWMRGNINADFILDKASNDTGLDRNFLNKELIKSCEEMDICKDSLQLIQDIRDKGKKCVLASDNMDVFEKYTIPALNLGEYFDDILLSNKIGYLKSDFIPKASPFFHSYLKNNHTDYNQSCLVDDSEANSIAKNYGMNFFRVDNDKDGTKTTDYLRKFAG